MRTHTFLSDTPFPLLQTKLHRPRVTHDLVVRTRLLERLNRELNSRLIMVCAAAGFGKTTLVSAWLELMAAGKFSPESSLPAAWLSLDENDSDLTIFLRYFIAALRTIFPDACEETMMLLQASQQPPQAMIYTTLSNEIEQLSDSFILVLDDYHTIHSMEVHDLLAELVRHWPTPLHLVLISRISPPIPLTNLRAKGMLSEIRARDLRFTTEETAAYLSQAQPGLLSQNALPLLDERFEGWPAGLHLATLSLRAETSQETILSALSSENINITSYLVDEVLTHQFPAIQSFLLKTSILDRFCAALCEAILGEIDAAWNVRACLDWIERSELFITSLDNRREWYRYHHLFQELLQQRAAAELAADQAAELHRLASAWFAEHDLIDEALHHALAADDLDLATRQMSQGLRDVLNREDRPTLERWLRLLPEEVIQRRPELLMIKVWALQFSWRLGPQAQVLGQVAELLDAQGGATLPADDLGALRGQILVFRAQQAYLSNQTTPAIDLCRQALALLPPTWTFARGGAMLYLGLSMQANGQAPEVERLLLAEYEACSDKSDTFALFLLRTLGFIYINIGQLEQARQISQVLLQGATHRRKAIMKHWGDWYLGVASYQRNDLQTAAQHFTQIVNNPFAAHISAYRDAVAGLTLIHLIKGESAEAKQMVASISQFDLEQRGSEDQRTRSLRARLELLQGDMEAAGDWADTFNDLPPDQPLLWLEEPQATRVRLLLARGADGDLRLAQQILDVLAEIAERTHNTRYKIEILALRALALEAQGETGHADNALKQAVNLARPGGFIRVFADLGNPMQAMLRRLEKQAHSAEMVRRILEAFPAEMSPPENTPAGNGVNLPPNPSPAPPASRPSLGISTLIEPLTPRELEVLVLLREPMSIKEIASKLYISPATVKRHTINLYAKLGVNNRWNAVSRAEELNILHPR